MLKRRNELIRERIAVRKPMQNVNLGSAQRTCGATSVSTIVVSTTYLGFCFLSDLLVRCESAVLTIEAAHGDARKGCATCVKKTNGRGRDGRETLRIPADAPRAHRARVKWVECDLDLCHQAKQRHLGHGEERARRHEEGKQLISPKRKKQLAGAPPAQNGARLSSGRRRPTDGQLFTATCQTELPLSSTDEALDHAHYRSIGTI